MKTVLLVDDDSIFQFLGQKLLHLAGISHSDIRIARDGMQAIEVFNQHTARNHRPPDVVFLDLRMPVMDGFGFLEAYSRMSFPGKENIRIVVLSSSINPDDIKRAHAYGISGYIVKPLTEQKLREALDEPADPHVQ